MVRAEEAYEVGDAGAGRIREEGSCRSKQKGLGGWLDGINVRGKLVGVLEFREVR